MSDGLKLAAGDGPRRILGSWIATPLRGLIAGALHTAIVQSSSAVVFTAIGFVNAGLLSLRQAIGVFYGSNLGTIVTAWLVALVGFNLDLKPAALPAIAFGVLLRVSGGVNRRGLIGDVLTGLGVFLLGIEVLKAAFPDLGNEAIASFQIDSWGAQIALLLAGAALTGLIQSSSAVLAVVLVGVASGLIPLTAGAATIIGANIGTTSTAAFATLGATPSAKRAAVAHVVFNLVAAAIAFVLMPVLLELLRVFSGTVGLDTKPAILLALFHTLASVIGVAAFYPFTGTLARFLEARFRNAEEDETKLQHLDQNAAATPAAALAALRLELARAGRVAHRAVQGVLSEPARDAEHLARDQQTVETLTQAMGDFIAQLQRRAIPLEVAEALPQVLRISQYYDDMTRRALEIANLRASLPPDTADPHLSEPLEKLRHTAGRLLRSTDPEGDAFHPGYYEPLLQQAQTEYQSLKDLLLRTGSEGRLSVRQMAARLDQISSLRRALEQAVKAARRVQALTAEH